MAIALEHPGSPLLATLEQRVEALLFATSHPVSVEDIVERLPQGANVREAIENIRAFWAERGVILHEGPDGFTMRPVRTLLPERADVTSRRLSEAALATLATIAMHQPVTLPEIERVRGVKVARPIMESLKTAGLIVESRRRSGRGSPVTYVVSEVFLERFDLEQLADLPTPEEALGLDLDVPVSVPPGSAAQ